MITLYDADSPELFLYLKLSENQLARYCEPDPGYFVAESLKVTERALAAGYEPVSLLCEDRLIKEAGNMLDRCGIDKDRIPVCILSPQVIRAIRGFELTGGVLCAMRRRKLPELEAITEGAARIAVLEDVENPTNVGAIIRSAAALGIDAVLLTQGCADPLYRRAARVSMGNVFNIPWTFIRDISQVRKAGFKTAAMALRNESAAVDDPVLKEEKKLALLLGNENSGLTDKTVNESDYTVKIPMSHDVDSLNVAAAAAIAFWELGHTDQSI